MSATSTKLQLRVISRSQNGRYCDCSDFKSEAVTTTSHLVLFCKGNVLYISGVRAKHVKCRTVFTSLIKHKILHSAQSATMISTFHSGYGLILAVKKKVTYLAGPQNTKIKTKRERESCLSHVVIISSRKKNLVAPLQ